MQGDPHLDEDSLINFLFNIRSICRYISSLSTGLSLYGDLFVGLASGTRSTLNSTECWGGGPGGNSTLKMSLNFLKSDCTQEFWELKSESDIAEREVEIERPDPTGVPVSPVHFVAEFSLLLSFSLLPVPIRRSEPESTESQVSDRRVIKSFSSIPMDLCRLDLGIHIDAGVSIQVTEDLDRKLLVGSRDWLDLPRLKWDF